MRVLWVTIGMLLLSLPAGAQTLSDLYNEEKALDKQINETLRLFLDPNQPNLGGTNEKFLVQDQLGRRWVFKIHPDPGLDTVSEIAYYAACYLDVKVPRTYVHTLTVNGEPRKGNLQVWVEGAENMKDILPNELTNSQLNQLFKQQIFDYFLANYDVRQENFLYQKQTGELWGIDKDLAFDYWDEDLPLTLNPGAELAYFEDYYVEAWNNYILSPKEVSWGSLLAFIEYINGLDTTFVQELVSPAFKLARVRENVGSLQDYMEYLGKMKEEFTRFYTLIREEKELPVENLTFFGGAEYAENVKEAALARMSQKKEELLKLKENAAGDQKAFTLVMSRRAWKYVLDNEAKGPKIILAGLERILNQTRDANEREAVQLYIEQVKEWDPNNPINWDITYVAKLPQGNIR